MLPSAAIAIHESTCSAAARFHPAAQPLRLSRLHGTAPPTLNPTTRAPGFFKKFLRENPSRFSGAAIASGSHFLCHRAITCPAFLMARIIRTCAKQRHNAGHRFLDLRFAGLRILSGKPWRS
jgi:hypothetical protein